jgi:hypothetical protein
MIEPRPSVVRFVGEIWRAERARDGDGGDLDVTQAVIKRFHGGLAKIIGPAGFDVLLARSVVLARRAHPSLAGISGGPNGTLAGIAEEAVPERVQEDGAMAIVAHFMELLVTLIGEDLAMRLARPAFSEGAALEGAEEEKQ